MTFLKSLSGAVVLLATLLATPACGETWYRADTDNFIVLTTGSENDLRRRALDLERFDGLMRSLYRVPSDPSPNRLTVYLLDDEQDIMRAIACRKYGGIAGFYSGKIDGSYFVSHRRRQSSRQALQPEEVQFHEYAHHFMFRYFPFAYPGWYREGFAEYYGTVEFDEDGNWQYGKPPLHRGSTLISGRQIPVEKMLTVAQRDLSEEESYQVYTRGWLLTHMLHSDPERGRQLNQFLTAVARGEDRAAAAREAFGDLDSLERDLRKYMGQRPTYIRGREPIVYKGRFDIAQLDETESHFEQLRLDNRRSCDRKLTRDRLERLAGSAPNLAQVWNELADAEHMLAHAAAENAWKKLDDKEAPKLAPNMSLALAAVDKALAVDAENPRAHALKAEFLIDVARHSKDAGTWASAREHAGRANRANPDDAFPLSLFYDTYADAGEEIPEIARAGLARAFELAPEVDDLRVDYALSLALHGEHDRAVEVVEFLVASPHSEKRGRLALIQIEALREGKPYLEVAEMKLPEEDEEE